VVEDAREQRRENILLRAELSRLTLEHTRVRELHLQRRRRCDETVSHATLKRNALPSWPVWLGPTDDLRLTLVSLE
jgi:hypothetical protein